jgi:hypothetical protein
MSGAISVFISYRKQLENDQGEQIELTKNQTAETLCDLVEQAADFDPWLDRKKLAPGTHWARKIYDQLLVTDVVLLLIGPGTSKSDWVRREIALAQALGISVVPLGDAEDITEADLIKEVEALGLAELQWQRTKYIDAAIGPDYLLAQIGASLREAAEETQRRHVRVLDALRDRRKPKVANPESQAKRFKLTVGTRDVPLFIASGDIAGLYGIDVLVNSENDYMQMARHFERSVSASLRRLGARTSTDTGRYEDVIQDELDWRLGVLSRPVQPGDVFPTSAGGPGSSLATDNMVKVILHVASVHADTADRRVVPFRQPDQIRRCVRGALLEMATINAASGIFSPPGSPQREEQEQRAAAGDGRLRSILFPLFGTGVGGASVPEVVELMLNALVGFLSDHTAKLVDDLDGIYLSAFSEDDVAAVDAVLTARLG